MEYRQGLVHRERDFPRNCGWTDVVDDDSNEGFGADVDVPVALLLFADELSDQWGLFEAIEIASSQFGPSNGCLCVMRVPETMFLGNFTRIKGFFEKTASIHFLKLRALEEESATVLSANASLGSVLFASPHYTAHLCTTKPDEGAVVNPKANQNFLSNYVIDMNANHSQCHVPPENPIDTFVQSGAIQNTREQYLLSCPSHAFSKIVNRKLLIFNCAQHGGTPRYSFDRRNVSIPYTAAVSLADKEWVIAECNLPVLGNVRNVLCVTALQRKTKR